MQVEAGFHLIALTVTSFAVGMPPCAPGSIEAHRDFSCRSLALELMKTLCEPIKVESPAISSRSFRLLKFVVTFPACGDRGGTIDTSRHAQSLRLSRSVDSQARGGVRGMSQSSPPG